MRRVPKNLPATLLHLLVSIAMLLVLCISVFAQDDESINTARTGTLSGRVVTESGQPIPHAAVYIGAPMNPMQSRNSATDDNGNFQLDGLDPLIYTVIASAPSYYATPRDPEALPPYYRIGDSVTITMSKGGVITGTVTSANGEPLVQASVRAIMIRDANGKALTSGRVGIDRQTDDRGVYRVYSLPAGTFIVAVGGRGTYGYASNPYDTDAPTYAPGSSRDTAAEITVRSGEETTADIRYRGELGHVVSGVVNGPITQNSNTNITLAQVVNGVSFYSAMSYQAFNARGFAFYGVADGEYDLIAQTYFGVGETVASEPRRITVKGGDVSGIELAVKELASIKGHVALEPSPASECKNKRQPLLSETVVFVRRSDIRTPKEQLALPNFFGQSVPDQSGDFVLKNLAAGQFNVEARFFAKYWYLRSIVQNSGLPPIGNKAANRQTDVAKNGLTLRFGEHAGGVTITLAAGATSLRGTVKPSAGESLPAKLYVRLIPAEKENADDALRYFTGLVQPNGAFAINNVPPGRYWALAQPATENETQFAGKLRTPEAADARAKLRRGAEAAKAEIELKPCQNMIDYQLPLHSSSAKN
jgi:hypothetical protein